MVGRSIFAAIFVLVFLAGIVAPTLVTGGHGNQDSELESNLFVALATPFYSYSV